MTSNELYMQIVAADSDPKHHADINIGGGAKLGFVRLPDGIYILPKDPDGLAGYSYAVLVPENISTEWAADICAEFAKFDEIFADKPFTVKSSVKEAWSVFGVPSAKEVRYPIEGNVFVLLSGNISGRFEVDGKPVETGKFTGDLGLKEAKDTIDSFPPATFSNKINAVKALRTATRNYYNAHINSDVADLRKQLKFAHEELADKKHFVDPAKIEVWEISIPIPMLGAEIKVKATYANMAAPVYATYTFDGKPVEMAEAQRKALPAIWNLKDSGAVRIA